MFDAGILKAEEVEDTVQADGRDGLACRRFDFGLGVERNPEACEVEHRQGVGALADSYRLGDVDLLELAQQPQQFGLAASVDHLAGIAARSLPSSISSSLA